MNLIRFRRYCRSHRWLSLYVGRSRKNVEYFMKRRINVWSRTCFWNRSESEINLNTLEDRRFIKLTLISLHFSDTSGKFKISCHENHPTETVTWTPPIQLDVIRWPTKIQMLILVIIDRWLCAIQWRYVFSIIKSQQPIGCVHRLVRTNLSANNCNYFRREKKNMSFAFEQFDDFSVESLLPTMRELSLTITAVLPRRPPFETKQFGSCQSNVEKYREIIGFHSFEMAFDFRSFFAFDFRPAIY